jgi:UDP-glucose 4-epimerase
MAVLVTGGRGFIGYYTCLELISKGYEVIVFDNLSQRNNLPSIDGVEFVQGDVLDNDKLISLVKRAGQGVIHLAADSRVLPSIGSTKAAFNSLRVNIDGTINLLKLILELNPSIPFVYAGSSTAYGDSNMPQAENTAINPQTPYATGKYCGEMILRSFQQTFNFNSVVLRYFQVYGVGQPSQGAYALVTGIFLDQLEQGLPLTIEGDGLQSRDFVHVKDVARANVLALQLNDKSDNIPINIGTGITTSILDLAHLYSKNLEFKPARRLDLPGTQADISRAKTILNWNPTIYLQEGVKNLIERHI